MPSIGVIASDVKAGVKAGKVIVRIYNLAASRRETDDGSRTLFSLRAPHTRAAEWRNLGHCSPGKYDGTASIKPPALPSPAFRKIK